METDKPLRGNDLASAKVAPAVSILKLVEKFKHPGQADSDAQRDREVRLAGAWIVRLVSNGSAAGERLTSRQSQGIDGS